MLYFCVLASLHTYNLKCQQNARQLSKRLPSLVKESIKNPENPLINLNNQGVKKAAELIDYEQLTPEEVRESKNSSAAESAKNAYEQDTLLRGKIEIARNAIIEGFDNQVIARLTGLTIEQIDDLRNEK